MEKVEEVDDAGDDATAAAAPDALSARGSALYHP